MFYDICHCLILTELEISPKTTGVTKGRPMPLLFDGQLLSGHALVPSILLIVKPLTRTFGLP